MMQLANKRIWLLYRVSYSSMVLGPELRLIQLVNALSILGMRIEVRVLAGSNNPFPSEIGFGHLKSGFSREINIGDAVIASELLPIRFQNELLRAKIPFHADMYGLSLPETLCFNGQWKPLKSKLDRIRKITRYSVLSRSAERIYTSNIQQAHFLSGISVCGLDSADGEAALSLPSRIIQAPMGIRETKFCATKESPYPETWSTDPIFLWGGGIWKWFDTSKLLYTFAALTKEGYRGRLFFLSGRNEATSDYDSPLKETMQLAESLGIKDEFVAFNDRRVSTAEELSPYLNFCTAGIMANAPNLESQLSWRTRYLDLLWAGRPLIALGADPLALVMEAHGAALVCKGYGIPESISTLKTFFSLSISQVNQMNKSSKELGVSLSPANTLNGIIDCISNPDLFRWRGKSYLPREVIRYLFGV